MEALEKSLVHVQVLVIGDLKDVGHGVSIAGKAELGLLVGPEGGLALDRRNDILQGGVVALDAVRALDCTGERHASERSGPSPRLSYPIAKLLTLLRKQREHFLLVISQAGGLEDHDI
jgi:hypothetical protein